MSGRVRELAALLSIAGDPSELREAIAGMERGDVDRLLLEAVMMLASVVASFEMRLEP